MAIIDTMRRLARGDSGVRSSLNTADEIGELARQFNRMVDVQEAATNNIRNENEQLNNSVIMLLEVVAKLSQKDLTIHAPVAKDLTGPLGDALNMLTTEIARALQRISDISVDVTQASLSVREQADLVSSVADSEREQVEKTAVELDNAALTMLRIAKLAQTTNTAADKATLTTQNAIETVNATIASIEFIRETVRDAGGRIEQLGIHSQEISSVVDLIGGIARRTQILAVSASMHAASAGEAGQGFQVIANEVQRLAETAQQAAAKIGALLANIQGEIIDTVATMNSVTKQVMDGSKLAEQAGEQMRITQRTTSDLVTSVQIIAESSQEQAQSSADLLGR
ncbi:MAG: methyl-accepting chemotaxis protein, partial [Actinobacteria bacterium]|nr:methyl-accepting chemotaxis protein [Actinomycetota bacterium]